MKAATVLMGYSEGVIKPGSRLIDQPIKLAGTSSEKLNF